MLVYFAYFAFLGITTPYLPLWLAGKRLDPHMIAATGATVTLAATIGQLLLPSIALPFGLRRMTILTAACAFITTAALAVAATPILILAAAGISGLFTGAMIPLADAHALARPGSNYGRIRALGSVGFAVANLGGGWAIDRFGPGTVVPLEVMLLALLLFSALLAKPAPPAAARAPSPIRRDLVTVALRADLWLLILAVATINASHAYYYTFGNLRWTKVLGHDAATAGELWAAGVFSEILMLALFGRVRGLRASVGLIFIGAICGVLRWTCTAYDPPLSLLFLLQALHGFTFGATLLGGVQALRLMVDERIAPAALGLFAAMVHGVMIGGVTMLLGDRFGPVGPGGFLLMAAIAGLGAVLTLLFAIVAQRQGLAGDGTTDRPRLSI